MSTENTDTDCRKCKAEMTPFKLPQSLGPLSRLASSMTVTGYACGKCGHWNNLKRRKKGAK